MRGRSMLVLQRNTNDYFKAVGRRSLFAPMGLSLRSDICDSTGRYDRSKRYIQLLYSDSGQSSNYPTSNAPLRRSLGNQTTAITVTQ
jgi:hypothetical protein